ACAVVDARESRGGLNRGGERARALVAPARSLDGPLQKCVMPQLRGQDRDERLILARTSNTPGDAATQQAGDGRSIEDPSAPNRLGAQQLVHVRTLGTIEDGRGVGGPRRLLGARGHLEEPERSGPG